MLRYYKVDENGAEETDAERGNWLIIQDEREEGMDELVKKLGLPKGIFLGRDAAEEVTRLEYLEGTKLKNPVSIVLTDLTKDENNSIEARLKPISFIASDELLITYACEDSEFIDRLLEKRKKKLTNFHRIVGYSILSIYNHFILELQEKKAEIDGLDDAARRTTKNEELFKLADMERDMVYLDHTLADQKETVEQVLDSANFCEKLDDKKLIHDIRLRHRQADKMVDIYRDLLETIGGLFSDMMDNNLNHLMKYLDSAALVISVPALISGIWGMNTGGLPGEGSKTGFWLVMALGTILAIVTAVHLSRKNYND